MQEEKHIVCFCERFEGIDGCVGGWDRGVSCKCRWFCKSFGKICCGGAGVYGFEHEKIVLHVNRDFGAGSELHESGRSGGVGGCFEKTEFCAAFDSGAQGKQACGKVGREQDVLHLYFGKVAGVGAEGAINTASAKG